MTLREAAGLIDASVAMIGRIVGITALAGLMTITILDVVLRKFARIASPQLQDLEWQLFFAAVLVGFSFAMVRDAHVRVDMLRDRMSERLRSWIELAGFALAAAPLCLILIWYGISFAHDAFAVGERARAALGLPYRWIIKAFIPFGFLLLLAACAAAALRLVERLRG